MSKIKTEYPHLRFIRIGDYWEISVYPDGSFGGDILYSEVLESWILEGGNMPVAYLSEVIEFVLLQRRLR